MYKNTSTYTVDLNTTLDKIFPNGLPVNSFIDKGRCAIGGTYSEITNENRCSIITVPNISIEHCKKANHPNLFILYADVSDVAIRDELTKVRKGQKFMTTPEGMRRIMRIAGESEVGRLQEIYQEWFLLLDEAHTYISEAYRDDILAPFDYFWDFKYKSIISATPYHFTDKQFYALHHHRVTFTSKLGKIDLVLAKSVDATLNKLLNNQDEFPGNIHIFYNSVTLIVNAIKRAGLTDCNIFCANDKDQRNMKRLGELKKFFKAEPKAGEYKKINFYTCKYFEGWDLHDENATMVFVTDVYRPHTLAGVSSKGKQAIGRLRGTFPEVAKPHQIIHITNHKYINEMKPIESFRLEYLHEAMFLIEQHDLYLKDCALTDRKPVVDPRLLPFTNINRQTNIATLNYMKLDQQINEAANNEIYNHIDFIEADWKDVANYDVERSYDDTVLETDSNVKRKSKATQLKEDIESLLSHRAAKAKGSFTIGKSIEKHIKETNPIAYDAVEYLDEKTLIDLKYNVKKVFAAIVTKSNHLAEVKVLQLIGQNFKIGKFYTTELIKKKLQQIYNQLEIRNINGKIRVATAEQLSEPGRFEMKEAKDDKKRNGHIITRAQFGLKMVA